MKFGSPNLALGAVIVVVLAALVLWLYPFADHSASPSVVPASSRPPATSSVPKPIPSPSASPTVKVATVGFVSAEQSLRSFANEIRVPVVLSGPLDRLPASGVPLPWRATGPDGAALASGTITMSMSHRERFIPILVPVGRDQVIVALGGAEGVQLGISETRVTIER